MIKFVLQDQVTLDPHIGTRTPTLSGEAPKRSETAPSGSYYGVNVTI